MKNRFISFVLDLRDFAYFSIFKNKGEKFAKMNYKFQIKSLIAPYFVALLLGSSAILFRLGIKIGDIADGNIFIVLLLGICALIVYNSLLSPLEKVYSNNPIDIEKIKTKYRYLKLKIFIFFLFGLLLIPILPYIITII